MGTTSDLVNFLQTGPPPVYIGFGSMLSRKPEETADLVFGSIGTHWTTWGVIIGLGWAKERAFSEDRVYGRLNSTHMVISRDCAVVHHGGAGTTGAGLRAGIPSIITPFFGDQAFWGQQVYALGVGPQPIPRRRLTVDNLAEAIQRAVTDRAMQKNASNLGERIRAENGIAQAVAVIEQTRSPK